MTVPAMSVSLSVRVVVAVATGPTGLRTGLLLPGWLLRTAPFKVLATFVALNTLMYATLAALKLVPRLRLPQSRGRDRRTHDRSIYAGTVPGPVDDAPADGAPAHAAADDGLADAPVDRGALVPSLREEG